MGTADRLEGVLLGTALGDALGLPCEGMSPEAIARRFGRVERFRLLGRTGFVSDDTEQSALVAQALARHGDRPAEVAGAFRRSLLGWFLRLPFGVGGATVRACLRIALGRRRTGVPSAGNGAAMRAAVAGVWLRDDETLRRAMSIALAEVTHVDPRAVQAAVFVAELAAACASSGPEGDRAELASAAARRVDEPTLGPAIRRAVDLARNGCPTADAARDIGTSGYVVHSVPLAAYGFVRHGGSVLGALSEIVGAGGDTDSTAAILGAWLGALHGAAALPAGLVGAIHDGPFGPSHLRALARDLAGQPAGSREARYSPAYALARNLLLMPVIVAHGLRRLLPW